MAPDRAPPPDIVCRALDKRFGDVEVLAPFDVTFEAGKTTALVGPSGCGKSTLLRLIAGLDTADSGELSIGGQTADAVRGAGDLAIAFQDASLLPWRTARGNVALAQRLARQPVDRVAIDALLNRVGLTGFLDTRPGALSGGMRQRAAIARCLITRPRLLLLDEPFGAVDELTRRQLGLELPPLWRSEGTTTLLVTHSVTEAIFLSDRILVLSPRPARVLEYVEVRLGHPRASEMMEQAEFTDAFKTVTAALERGEAQRQNALAAQ
ncbi:MAG: ABC transporter ATP-binding protein [Dinoroseobacter sp.]|nr:ABC transporter ATP-binding protein [Dinoroseobacter sp.]